jgi:hypothetical protein
MEAPLLLTRPPIAAPRAVPGSGTRRVDWHDAYFKLLLFSLAGYALMGKGFAYVGYPPLLIGELAMVLGLIVIYRSGCALATLTTLPSILLATMLALVAYRSITAVGVYGLDAVRDGVIIIYGIYAFAVIALVLEKPERISLTLSAYSRFAWLFGIIGGSLTYITTMLADYLPAWPSSGVTIIYVRLGETGVHLAGVAIFVLLGLRKVSRLWLAALFIGLLLITISRGAMLACFVPIGIAALLDGQLRRISAIVLVAMSVLGATYLAGVNIPLPSGRSIGAEQIVENFNSIVGTSDTSNLDGTKAWRLRWWKAIEDYTFRGPYFWTGKGFGMGLAEEDGFVVGKEFGTPIVRSPHNAHYTLLARMGVPGLALWVALNAAWFFMMLRHWAMARRRGDVQWAKIFIWVGCYALAALINGTFDVALEGPMQGIWFWSLFGFGIATTMVYRYSIKPGFVRAEAAARPLRYSS